MNYTRVRTHWLERVANKRLMHDESSLMSHHPTMLVATMNTTPFFLGDLSTYFFFLAAALPAAAVVVSASALGAGLGGGTPSIPLIIWVMEHLPQ
jgi:hypothetical protein